MTIKSICYFFFFFFFFGPPPLRIQHRIFMFTVYLIHGADVGFVCVLWSVRSCPYVGVIHGCEGVCVRVCVCVSVRSWIFVGKRVVLWVNGNAEFRQMVSLIHSEVVNVVEWELTQAVLKRKVIRKTSIEQNVHYFVLYVGMKVNCL
jgi:hypothetical protein